IELLLVLVVGAYSRDERPRPDHLARDEVVARRRASHDDVAFRDRARQVGDGGNRKPRFGTDRGCERPGFFRVLVAGVDALEAAHPQQRPQLRRRLAAAAADERCPAVLPRQVFGRDRGGSGRARSAVMAIESMTARGWPVTASHRTTTPCMVGSPCRAPLCGKLALVLAAK